MNDVLGIALVVAVFAVPLAGLPWLASRVRRQGVGAGVLEPFVEIWGNPGAERSRIVVEAQQERRAPSPSPGDPPA